jgi:hypothetical protein
MTDATLRTMLTFAPDGTPWTSLLELQNQASVLAVSRYANSDKHTNPPNSKRNRNAGPKDYTTFPHNAPMYGKTNADRAVHHAKYSLNGLAGALRYPNKPRSAPHNKGGRGRGGGHNGGKGRGSGGYSGGYGGGGYGGGGSNGASGSGHGRHSNGYGGPNFETGPMKRKYDDSA